MESELGMSHVSAPAGIASPSRCRPTPGLPPLTAQCAQAHGGVARHP